MLKQSRFSRQPLILQSAALTTVFVVTLCVTRRVKTRESRVSTKWVINTTVAVNLNTCCQHILRPTAHMPGPHNAKKKKRAHQKKKKQHANSKTHTSTPVSVQPIYPEVSDLVSSPIPVSLPIPAKTDPPDNKSPDLHERIPWPDHDTPSLPASPLEYGPPDDPTLVLLSNPIIHDPGNGPRVRNMRAFLDSSFSQPAWMDDPLCAEFAQHEILQMLYTVLPEETALVRNLPLQSTH